MTAPSVFVTGGKGVIIVPPWAMIVLGSALGYERPHKIRDLIERLMPKLLKFGTARHRVALYARGNGTKGETTATSWRDGRARLGAGI